MHSLSQRVLSHIRRQRWLMAGERVGVAVSGGIDSVALLRVLIELRGELGIVLSVIHFNHKLRGLESDVDEEFVADLARAHDLDFLADSDDVAGHAQELRISLETAARELRYGFFRYLIRSRETSTEVNTPTLGAIPLDKVVTGHTLDDQAETVLMRLVRGSGLRGIGGIHPRVPVEDDEGEFYGEIVRPLLAVRRRELEEYLREIGQGWREDSSNTDESFTRNRVRKLVVPLLEKEFNPSVAESLAELAEIARGEEDYWENEVEGWMGTAVQWVEPEWARRDGLVQIAGLGGDSTIGESPTSRAQSAREMGHPGSDSSQAEDLQSRIASADWLIMNASVSLLWFLGEPLAVQRRVVKAIGEQAGISLEFKHIEEVLRLAEEEGESAKEISLPRCWKAVRREEELLFLTPDLRKGAALKDYEYPLAVPGRVAIHEAGLMVEATRVPGHEVAEYNPDNLMDATSLPGPLRVRNWRPGDRFWPSHTKSPKKVKELLQELHVAQPERRLWPVVVSGKEIVWVRGFPAHAKFQAKTGGDAILILGSELECG